MNELGYRTLTELLDHELVMTEYESTAVITKRLRHVRRDRVLTKTELRAVCYEKSPRAIQWIDRNPPATVRRLTRAAFTTRSEREKLRLLTELKGVGVPMASAILTFIWPERYGIIDIRVWRLLYALRSVKSNADGVGFNFNHWYSYLSKLRYHAKRLNVPVRTVERTLFDYHKRVQEGTLYRRKQSERTSNIASVKSR